MATRAGRTQVGVSVVHRTTQWLKSCPDSALRDICAHFCGQENCDMCTTVERDILLTHALIESLACEYA